MNRHDRRIRNVAVLGSGTMGSQIAAHCVNAGLSVWLYDLKSDDPLDPDKRTRDNVRKLRKMKPSPLALPEFSDRIRIRNFDDDLHNLADMDWICEAVIEKIDIKRELFGRIEKVWSPGTILSSNTSGLPVRQISEGFSPEFRRHFLGTHFFNPPRYMKLLEVIPTGHTDEKITDMMVSFCESVLGKGVVQCSDTPNFIANRIGIFSMASILPRFFDGEFRAEEIDYLTGTLTGYSRSATFRTADIVGIDVLKHVAENLYPAVPDDEMREVFRFPGGVDKMINNGWLGNKTGQGFYKKVSADKGEEYYVLNPEKMSYEPQKKVYAESVGRAMEKYKTSGERLRYLVGREDNAGEFLWQLQRDLLIYSSNRIREIRTSPEAIDRAMKWGFNWELGPFERWDALGVEESVSRMERENVKVPAPVLKMLDTGRKNFYENGSVYNPVTEKIEYLSPPARGAVTISILAGDDREVWGDSHAGLYDMGDGVALMEFRTRKQTLGFSLVEAMQTACEKVNEYFDALVIGHDHENFSYGANLAEVLSLISDNRREKLLEAVSRFQQTVVGLRYQPFPIVAAVSGRVFGGGAEIMMHCDRVVAHHELHCGLVELGAGLIPGGGGTKELLLRMMENIPDDEQVDPVPYIKKAFKTIGMMKVSESAPHARQLGLLRRSDVIVMNRHRLLGTARQQAISLAEAVYQPPVEPRIRVTGRVGKSILKLMIYLLSEAGFVTPYDEVLAGKVANILSGGALSEPQEVPESYMLKLEREAIDELLDDDRTRKRMEHMLKTGKPLRN